MFVVVKMMAPPNLNVDLLMINMLMIWITLHLDSRGFNEPSAPCLRRIPLVFSAVLLMFELTMQNKTKSTPGLQVY